MTTTTELIPMSPAQMSLRSICQELAILADSEPTPENEALHNEWLAEMAGGSEVARTKVDRVVMFIRRMEAEITWAKEEAAYHTERARVMQAGLERVKARCVDTVQTYAPDPPVDKHGKPRHSKRIDGIVGFLAIQQNPASVVVDPGADLPIEYCNPAVQFSREGWERTHAVLAMNDPATAELFACATTWTADKKALKAALESGAEIAGADLKFGEMRLALPRPGKVEVAE